LRPPTALTQQPPPSQYNRLRADYGTNVLPEPQRVTFMELVIAALDDRMLIMLCIAAGVSLILGMVPATQGEDHDSSTGWIEGAAIYFAVIIVVLTTAINDFQKEKQFRALNALKDDRFIDVGSAIAIALATFICVLCSLLCARSQISRAIICNSVSTR
jgi:Ca2+-transporting ATPase